jgi:hypothetical protein
MVIALLEFVNLIKQGVKKYFNDIINELIKGVRKIVHPFLYSRNEKAALYEI